jgi:hypothetical protein
MDSDPAVEIAPFDAVPEEALRVIMLALPVDARGQAACVCRSWRAFLADPSLWQVLDLTPAGGVARERVTENLVRGAVHRAAGLLRVLSWNEDIAENLSDLLLVVIVSYGAELQEVNANVNVSLNLTLLNAVLAAAPRLQALNTRVGGSCTELLPCLRNDPPYGSLRVCHLNVWHGGFFAAHTDLLALAAAVAAHESLKSLSLLHLRVARGVNALMDAAAERRVAQLSIHHCAWDAENFHALARLLQRGSLTKLSVICLGFPVALEESWVELCAALRACHTLTHLELVLHPSDDATRHIITELLDAAASLPALSELDLSNSRWQDTTAFGRALGALLAANLPSLRALRVYGCRLGDEGLAPLLNGLAANTHLLELDCRNNGNLSEWFERDRLRPALAALAARAALNA